MDTQIIPKSLIIVIGNTDRITNKNMDVQISYKNIRWTKYVLNQLTASKSPNIRAFEKTGYLEIIIDLQ